MSTRNLVAKAYCYRRQRIWDMQDDREPIVSKTTIKGLQVALLKQPHTELQRAAQELGINLAEVGLHEC
jgi:hypothetical protein